MDPRDFNITIIGNKTLGDSNANKIDLGKFFNRLKSKFILIPKPLSLDAFTTAELALSTAASTVCPDIKIKSLIASFIKTGSIGMFTLSQSSKTITP